MKILRWLFALVMLIATTEAMAAGHSVDVYYGYNGDSRNIATFNLIIMMPSAVYVGEYKSSQWLMTVPSKYQQSKLSWITVWVELRVLYI